MSKINIIHYTWPEYVPLSLDTLRVLTGAPGERRQWYILLPKAEAEYKAEDMPGFIQVHRYAPLCIDATSDNEIGCIGNVRFFSVDCPIQPRNIAATMASMKKAEAEARETKFGLDPKAIFDAFLGVSARNSHKAA